MHEKIVTVCLGKDRVWYDRKEAVLFFRKALQSCEPDSTDWDHYMTVLTKLETGRTVARDWD